ncbi:MAG: phosphatase PAP2 family protein [Bacillota bacterium]|jgi:membrane-associated phospholipid phosphatase
MNKERFLEISRWFGSYQYRRTLLIWSEKLSVIFFYIFYAALLLILLFSHNPEILRALLVPAVVFFGGTLLRSALNRPRPYEVWQTEPLVPKNTKGKSFPSRHALSAAVITSAWLWYSQTVGIILVFMLFLVCLIRVIAGVHFCRDVAAGAAFGLLFGCLGFFAL